MLVNTAAADVGLPAITSDNEGGGRLAAEHLLSLGHRRFGYLMPPPRFVDAPARLGGVVSALSGVGLGSDALTIGRGEPVVRGGEAAAHAVLDQTPDTTALLAYNDLMAIGALRALRQRRCAVPAQVSVVGFDDVAMASYVDPALTTIAQRTEEMARWAVDRLTGDGAEQGADPGAEPSTVPGSEDGPASSVLLPVDLRIRQSTGPAPRATAADPPRRPVPTGSV